MPNFQFHHQPFNYFANFAPGTPARAEHLKDGGLAGEAFLKDIDDGKLPAVSFCKPQGNLNEHGGHADVSSGDQHLADIVSHLEKSPQWGHMLVIVTYDENGGFWDHVAPPKADRWGPGQPHGLRHLALRQGWHGRSHPARYDFDHPSDHRALRSAARDTALRANGQPPLGDLTAALELTH